MSFFVANKEKNGLYIDKTVSVYIVYVRSAFQKSTGCKLCIKETEDDTRRQHCD